MKKLPIDYLGAFGTTVGDLYFPQTTLLLPFDGANGATTTSDLSNSNHTVTLNGSAAISTSQSKFGGSSILLDGNSDYITVTSSDLNLGGVSFTIEFWVYFNDIDSGNIACFYSDYGGASAGVIIHKSAGNNIAAYLTGDGQDITGTTTLAIDQWYHIALSGSVGSYKLFLNGTQEGSTFTGSPTNGTSTKNIGNFYWSTTGQARFLDGYIDDFRITKGIARYTSNFTPPTTSHLTSAGDVNKQILINSTADGVAIGTGGINQARLAKAWVHFNGSGTVAINDSYNMSSVTDRGTGRYKVNFSTVMSSTSYTTSGTVGNGADYTTPFAIRATTYATDGFSFATNWAGTSTIGYSDPTDVAVTVFGN